MKQLCLTCGRRAPIHRLYCQEPDCPAERAPIVLERGEWLGDIEIVRAVAVLASAVLYEGQRGGRTFLLKVAHPSRPARLRLQREAQLLAHLGGRSRRLPMLLPPLDDNPGYRLPYGVIELDGVRFVFCRLGAVAGSPLRDVLVQRPRLEVFQAGWIVAAMAEAVALMHSVGALHLALSPESVLVRFEGHVPAEVVLIDLGLASHVGSWHSDWHESLVTPARTAPELTLPRPSVSYRADVHGLGLTLYELLLGAPALTTMFRAPDEIYDAVRSGRLVELDRGDVAEVAALARRAVSVDPAGRQPDADTLAAELTSRFGDGPARPARAQQMVEQIAIVCLLLLALAFLVVLIAGVGAFA